MGTVIIRDGPLLWNHEKHRTFLLLVLYTLVLFQLSEAQTTSMTTSMTTNSNPSNSTSVDQSAPTSSSSSSPSSPSSSSPSPSPNASSSVSPPGDADTNITSSLNPNTAASGVVITTSLPPQNTTTQMIHGTDPLLTDIDLTTTSPETSFPTTVQGENATLSTPTVSRSEGETNSSTSDQPLVQSSTVSGTSASTQETAAMETAESHVTYALDVTEWNNTYWDVTPKTEDDDTGAFIRLIIIAGATAGSCVVLLFVIFFVIFCVHRKQQKRKNARYYEFKKKNYKAKYEKVEQKSSLARRDKEPETPIGPGWVFNTSMHHGEYDDDLSQNVALRSITPLGGAAVPQVKLNFLDEQNGPPDSGHGGSIAPDDSALGVSASLEEEMEEFDLNPIYNRLGTSVGTGSDVRDHSCTGGDSDTISEGNEPIAPNPIRDVQFNSFGTAGRVASEDAVDL